MKTQQKIVTKNWMISKSLNLAIIAMVGSFALTAGAAPHKGQSSQSSASEDSSHGANGQSQGRGHCEHGQGNGYGHERNHADDCSCEQDEDQDSLVDPETEYSDDGSDGESEDQDSDGSCDDHGNNGGGNNGGGNNGGGNNGGGNNGGGGRVVKAPGKLNLSGIRSHSRIVTEGFDLSLSEPRLISSTITHVLFFDTPFYGPFDQICAPGEAVYSVTQSYGRSRIQCAPIQDQVETPSFNEWASGVSVQDALHLRTFSLNQGVSSVRAHFIGRAFTHYSYHVDSGEGSVKTDSSLFCPRNQVLVGVRSVDSRFPFNRSLTTRLQPYCADVIVTAKQRDLRYHGPTPVDTSGARSVGAPNPSIR